MEKPINPFAWIKKLECPPTIYNDSVKKILYTGAAVLLWDDLADVIFTADEVKTIRKNILLHQLKQGMPNNVVQCIQNIVQLKSAQNNLENDISKLDEEYKQLNFTVRQKAQKLRDISSKSSQVKVMKDLLKMKYDQTATQIGDCNNMRLVCQHLMPSNCKDVDTKLLSEMSNAVTSLWTEANKKQVWDIIANNLNIEVPTLWRNLYKNFTQDVDTLIKSVTTKRLDFTEKSINVGFAKVHGQQISMVAKRLLHNAKANNHQQSILEFTEKIEVATNNSVDMITWLALALEVCKLETEQKCLLAEVDKIREDLNENNTLPVDLIEVISEIQDINTEIVKCTECIQQSLIHLKCLPKYFIEKKEEMNFVLQKILVLRNNIYDSVWSKTSLITELRIFHDTLDLNALRKVMLKGDVGIYRHTKRCFSEASVSITNTQASNITCYFPMIQTPVYSLIECYKNLTLMFLYKTFDSLQVDENVDALQIPIPSYEENNYNIHKLLNLSRIASTNIEAEINNFNEILNDWVHQTVEKVMDIIEKTVDDATFPEWVERYNLLLYIIQNSK
ncbi:PREDICTED: uncharacterized protein LOC107191766 [Dufourea novaeangliae]|uniref:uncharacterized protein LOC107191766 n=1 Tax=Dufourea novaeangliae TaxID=178035 RepID=UPI0007672433|nr:PREDICTED: uncharacterized protein LOC107191766 [Dufourea novaeangliae]